MAHQDDLSITATKAVRSDLPSSQDSITDKKIICGYIWKKVKKLPNPTKKRSMKYNMMNSEARRISTS